MPSWRVHRKWSREFGIPDDIDCKVDELIDKPKEFFLKEGKLDWDLISKLEKCDPRLGILIKSKFGYLPIRYTGRCLEHD